MYLKQPIIVQKKGDGYRIVAGERRWRAARIAGLSVIPAIVRDLTDRQTMEQALIENIQREDLNPIEEAMAIQNLLKTHKLTQDQLARTLMPLGGYSKDEVRQIAREAGLPCADKEDSQEICFVAEGRYTDFISEYSSKELPGEGDFVDREGNVLGRHKGIHQYTVGQRKGLGIALGYPAFVTKICPENNTVVLGTEDALLCDTFLCRDVNWQSIPGIEPGDKIRCLAKARYHQPARPAALELTEAGLLKVTLDEAVKGVSPGQSAVFYDEGGYVIGGGKITSA